MFVIVNALRKFESAGVIESRSSGMKGTYIKVLNEVIFDELEEIKAQENETQEGTYYFPCCVFDERQPGYSYHITALEQGG